MKVSEALNIKLAKVVIPVALISSFLLFQGCSDGAPKLKDASEQTVYITTQGVETFVDEVEPGNEFKITDEKILDSKDASRAIVHNLDQTIDTLSMASMKGESSDPRTEEH